MNPWMRCTRSFILTILSALFSVDVHEAAAEVKKEKIKSESWEHANKKEKLKTDVKKT